MTTPRSTNSDNAASAVAETKSVAEETAAAPPLPGEPRSFATRAKHDSAQLPKQNKTVLLAGGAAVVLLLAFVLISFPTHKATSSKPANSRQVSASQSSENPESEKSLFPITESGAPTNKDSQNGLIDEQDVQRTAIRQPAVAEVSETNLLPGGTLGSIPPFDSGAGAGQASLNQSASSDDEPAEEAPKKEREQPSLVFVHKEIPATTNNQPEIDLPGLGLATGTRLRARLEAAASTAVRTPVIAVVGYNYQKNGEIIIPAGSKALGHIEQADRSGYLSIRFDSLLMPDGSCALLFRSDVVELR